MSPSPLRAGQYPPGAVHRVDDLGRLAGQHFDDPQHPVYLVGHFVYLTTREGLDLFSDFIPEPNGQTDRLNFGHVLISVIWHNNRPLGIQVGRMIAPNPSEPLILPHVVREPGSDRLMVVTECWSLPPR